MAILATLQHVDTKLFSRVFRHGEQGGAVQLLAKVCSRSGDGFLHLIVPACFAIWGATELPTLCVLLGSAMFIERCLYFILKNSLKRRRPQDFVPGINSIIQASDKFSFPSGHTSAAFCLATSTGLVMGGPFIAMYLWACAVGLSRVVLGVHFPGDTVAGAIMGSAIALAAANQLALI